MAAKDEMLQNTLSIICEDIQEIRMSLQKTTIIQEHQAADIAKHIKRTDILQKHVERLERDQLTCPARMNITASKTVVGWAKDITVLLGLIALILKVFNLVG